MCCGLWTKYPDIFNELKLTEDFIKKNTHSRNKLLSEIINDLVSAGGKRLRPAFAIISAKFGTYDRDKVISLAGALEILHTATLVHDDVIDRAKLRRGRVTVAEKYGADMAVYTGDFLFTKAVLMLSRDISIERLDKVAQAIKTICEGEVDQFEDKYNTNTSILSYLKRINKKTAVLFTAACGLGAGITNCPEQIVKSLARFGFYYGMAFQIRDDLSDILFDTSITGKPAGSDIMKGTLTLPVIYSLRSFSRFQDFVKGCIGKKGGLTPQDAIDIIEMSKECGGVEYSRKMLKSYIDRGKKALERLPANNYKTIFYEMIDSLQI